jgi:hypothetical protein
VEGGGGGGRLNLDNAPALSSLLIRDFLTKHVKTLVPQSLYLLDMAPVDLCLITKLKSLLKGRLESVEEIKENPLAELCIVPQEAFQECFQNWKKCGE